VEKSIQSFETGFFGSFGTNIHPSSIIGKDVILGENVKIGPFCTIVGKTYIDSGTRLYGYVSIGMPAQDINTLQPRGTVEIGKNCEIREFVTISATKIHGSKTIIGNKCYIMNFSHVAHDVVLEDNVVLINNVNLGGHVHIGKNAMLMANTALHQFCKVGAYSALAPFSGMRQDIPPFCLFDGRPGRFAGLNLVALKRAGTETEDLRAIKAITNLFFKEKLTTNRIEEQVNKNKTLKENKYVQDFLLFVKNSDRGITRKTIHDSK